MKIKTIKKQEKKFLIEMSLIENRIHQNIKTSDVYDLLNALIIVDGVTYKVTKIHLTSLDNINYNDTITLETFKV